MVLFCESCTEQGGRNFALMCCSTRTFCRFFATVILRSSHNPLRFGQPLSSTSSLRRPAGKRRRQCQRTQQRMPGKRVCPIQSAGAATKENCNSWRMPNTLFGQRIRALRLLAAAPPLRTNAQGVNLSDGELSLWEFRSVRLPRKPGIRALVSAYASIL